MKRKNAFTLIEIMLVVIILGILVAMVVPNLAGRGQEARQAAARADIEANIATALDLYELDSGMFPTTDQGLQALIAKPTIPPVPHNWKGPYLRSKRVPLDPWGNPYIYVSPGKNNPQEYDLYSLGHDGVESENNITNWERSDF